MAQTWYLGYFCEKICHQELTKISQSGHKFKILMYLEAGLHRKLYYSITALKKDVKVSETWKYLNFYNIGHKWSIVVTVLGWARLIITTTTYSPNSFF